MKRRPLLAANWKMFKTVSEMESYVKDFLELVRDVSDRDILIAPSFVSLARMVQLLEKSIVQVGAQNMFYEDKGAYTGEISPLMLLDVGVKTVIIGHSERRHIFNEDDKMINRKVIAALHHGIAPVLCIGETLEERESGKTSKVLQTQLKNGLQDVDTEVIKKVIVAYEPVWAIGTGRTATLEQIQEAHSLVRKEVGTLAGEDIAQNMRILYGGSVKPANVRDIMRLEDVDGALVGGASLDPESFAKIVKFEQDI